jgi:hypothetical protein
MNFIHEHLKFIKLLPTNGEALIIFLKGSIAGEAVSCYPKW